MVFLILDVKFLRPLHDSSSFWLCINKQIFSKNPIHLFLLGCRFERILENIKTARFEEITFGKDSAWNSSMRWFLSQPNLPVVMKKNVAIIVAISVVISYQCGSVFFLQFHCSTILSSVWEVKEKKTDEF